VIDRLSPAERTSFILHDIFGFPSTPWLGSSGAPRRRAGDDEKLKGGRGSSSALSASAGVRNS
jgi:hypothetical protein